jgi:O-antigen ligase
MEYINIWTNGADIQRGNRGSLFPLILRLMALFVVVANYFSLIQAGPSSLLGYATVVLLLVALLGLAFSASKTLVVFRPLFLWAVFFFWMCFSFVVSGVAVPQPPIVNIALIAIMAFSAISAWAVPSQMHSLFAILRWAFVANAGIAALYLLSSYSGDLVGARTCAITAVLGLALLLSHWRHGHRLWLFISAAVVLVPLATLSRTAAACGLLLFPLSALRLPGRKTRWGRVAILAIAACALFYIATEMSPSLKSRFFFGGRSATDFVTGHATLDTSGRAEMWQAVIESWSYSWKTMLIGRGAGSNEDAAAAGVSTMAHPHNDYLALLHDYGAIGLSIFLIAFFKMLSGRWKAWGRAEAAGSEYAEIHSAAFLMALAFAIMMTTDNPLDYMFAIMPTAIVVGCSLGLEINQKRQALIDAPL